MLAGGAGDDLLDPGKGEGDQLSAAPTSTPSPTALAPLPSTIDLDGLADDGEVGENDLIDTDVENLTGGTVNDRLTGTAGANVLSGGAATTCSTATSAATATRWLRDRHRRLLGAVGLGHRRSGRRADDGEAGENGTRSRPTSRG